MSTTLMPDLAIATIDKHPKNPRHRAVADDDMVASVRENGLIQPVVVAPHPEKGTRYVLIAGHRRIDAAKKAKLKTIPAVLRTDLVTEGQQIEAMIIENGHRLDLTPIEEAEGYAQLELLGYKATQIATAVGRDVKTIRTRLKLLKLSASTRKKVDTGQMTIEDASALVEFADDPEATKRLERAAGDSWSWKSTLRSERSRRDTNRKIAVETAKLLEAGATEIDPKGRQSWQVWDHDLGPTPLSRTHSEDWGQHKGCLGFVHFPGGQYSSPTLDVCCTKPSNHTEQLDEHERELIAEAEAEAAQAAEREAAEEIASDVRVETLLNLVGTSTTMPAALRDIVRQLLPIAVADLSDNVALRAYQQAMNIVEEDRWEWVPPYDRARRPAELVKLRQHLEEIKAYSDNVLTRVLVAYLAANHEENLVQKCRRDPDEATTYLELLAEAGHAFGPIDTELRDALTSTEAAAS